MSDPMTRCLHCGKPMKWIAFACPHCGMPMSVDPNSIFSDEFLESIPLENHLKTRSFNEILKEEFIDSYKKQVTKLIENWRNEIEASKDMDSIGWVNGVQYCISELDKLESCDKRKK